MKETANDVTKKTALIVADYLKKNYPGQWVKKGSLRMLFDLPWNSASNLWHVIPIHGIIVKKDSVMAPLPSVELKRG